MQMDTASIDFPPLILGGKFSQVTKTSFLGRSLHLLGFWSGNNEALQLTEEELGNDFPSSHEQETMSTRNDVEKPLRGAPVFLKSF